MAYRGFLRPGRSALVETPLPRGVDLIVDLPRSSSASAANIALGVVATALCRRAGANAINASTQRGGYSTIKSPAAREVWPIIRARHA